LHTTRRHTTTIQQPPPPLTPLPPPPDIPKTPPAPNRADDADWAWRKMDGLRVDGREWKVEWATPADFKFFDKEWTEGGLDKRGRSRWGCGAD